MFRLHTSFFKDSGDINGIWDSPTSVNRRSGTRVTAVTAFLEPNLNRTNLIVLPGAHVCLILFKTLSSLLNLPLLLLGCPIALGNWSRTCQGHRSWIYLQRSISLRSRTQRSNNLCWGYSNASVCAMPDYQGQLILICRRILEYSGIGNSSILKKHGIRPVVELPGGE